MWEGIWILLGKILLPHKLIYQNHVPPISMQTIGHLTDKMYIAFQAVPAYCMILEVGHVILEVGFTWDSYIRGWTVTLEVGQLHGTVTLEVSQLH